MTEDADASAGGGGGEDVLERELREGPCRQAMGGSGPNIQRNQQWATNYKEAAIFLEVGYVYNYFLHFYCDG